MQYIYARYGREHAGIAAAVIRYRARSAVREVGKTMGLTEDVTAALAGTVWGWSADKLSDAQVHEAGLDPADRRLRKTLELSAELIGFPRHLSQHTGGFVLTQDPLCEVVPIGNAAMENRTFVEWDKDDLDTLGILKIDVLALGMLTCIRKSFDLIERHEGRRLGLADFYPMTDAATYDMLCKGDSVGVFQVESRAQMNMLPRLKPRCFYDLVIEVAIVRPGTIQGDMVHPYLRRRDGREPVDYPAPDPTYGSEDELDQVLGRTLGVPLFQEQAMKIAMVAARFSGEEANRLRRAMATFRHVGTIHTFEDKLIRGMTARGYDEAFARRCFKQIEGFGEYGFPESHAASFALLVYVSAWLKCHHPAVFACALLNSQPMGFYAPAQIVRDVRDHGIEVKPVDVNHSNWDCTLEPDRDGLSLRLGLRQVKGLVKEEAQKIVDARSSRYDSLGDLHARAGARAATIERLAAADTFRSLGLDRRQALWQAKALPNSPALPLFAAADARETGDETHVVLPEMHLCEHVVDDYRTLRLSLKAHPLSFLRPLLVDAGVAPLSQLKDMDDGTYTAVAGIVLVRQRPGTAKGVVFMTLEDETGIGNAVIWKKTMDRFRKEVVASRLVVVKGRIERAGDIVHLVADRLEDWSEKLLLLSEAADRLDPPMSTADEVRCGTGDPVAGNSVPIRARGERLPGSVIEPSKARTEQQHAPARHLRHVRHLIPKSRDFH